MYEIPSRTDVKKCAVTEETLRNRQRPLMITQSGQVIEEDIAAEPEDEEAGRRDVPA